MCWPLKKKKNELGLGFQTLVQEMGVVEDHSGRGRGALPDVLTRGATIGWTSLLATSGLAVWLEMGGSTWRSFRHTGCAILVSPTVFLVYALIKVGVQRTCYPLVWSVINMEIVPPHNFKVLP